MARNCTCPSVCFWRTEQRRSKNSYNRPSILQLPFSYFCTAITVISATQKTPQADSKCRTAKVRNRIQVEKYMHIRTSHIYNCQTHALNVKVCLPVSCIYYQHLSQIFSRYTCYVIHMELYFFYLPVSF